MISGGGNNQEQQREEEPDVEELLAAARNNNDSQQHAAVATSRGQWSAQTESRIVRVSRVFGGKDRHSKVKTVKGLRDRRVRLSVPTAIQLYDLQDRLGLNQPSKVVDWLLDNARHEIDKLPPLQFPLPPPLHDHHHHHLMVNNMPMVVHEEKFAHMPSNHQHQADVDVDGAGSGGRHNLLGRSSFPGGGGGGLGGYHRFMELNSALGMVSGGMAPSYSSYTAGGGEAWNNSGGGVQHVHDGGSPQVVTTAAAAGAAQHHHSAFPSLLSLAPRPHHQLVFYGSSEGDGQQFQVENGGGGLASQSLSLSSARAYHDDHQAS